MVHPLRVFIDGSVLRTRFTVKIRAGKKRCVEKMPHTRKWYLNLRKTQNYDVFVDQVLKRTTARDSFARNGGRTE